MACSHCSHHFQPYTRTYARAYARTRARQIQDERKTRKYEYVRMCHTSRFSMRYVGMRIFSEDATPARHADTPTRCQMLCNSNYKDVTWCQVATKEEKWETPTADLANGSSCALLPTSHRASLNAPKTKGFLSRRTSLQFWRASCKSNSPVTSKKSKNKQTGGGRQDSPLKSFGASHIGTVGDPEALDPPSLAANEDHILKRTRDLREISDSETQH